MSHDFELSPEQALREAGGRVDVAALVAQWGAVHDAAAAVGMLAQLGREDPGEDVLALPERAQALGGPRLDMVARGIDDLAAVLEPGLRALLEVSAKDGDATAAALTLWREFHTARAAIIALAPAE